MRNVHRLSPRPMHDLVCSIAPDAVMRAADFVYHNEDVFDLDYFRTWNVSVDVNASTELKKLDHLVRIAARAQTLGFEIELGPSFNEDDELRSLFVTLKSTFIERWPNTVPRPLVEITLGWLYPKSVGECITTTDQAFLAMNSWDALIKFWPADNRDPVSFEDAVRPWIVYEEV